MKAEYLGTNLGAWEFRTPIDLLGRAFFACTRATETRATEHRTTE